MCRHHSQHFKTRLQQQIRYGPLIVNLIADVGRQDNRDSSRLSVQGSTAQGKNNYRYEEFDGNSQGLKYESDGEIEKANRAIIQIKCGRSQSPAKQVMAVHVLACGSRRKHKAWGASPRLLMY